MIELVKKVMGPVLTVGCQLREREQTRGGEGEKGGVGKVDNELASEEGRGKLGREEVV
jgi:hypothetical protein